MAETFNERSRLRWEKRLVRRAQRGDGRVWRELYDAYARPLYARVLMPRVGEPAAAEDALAETFVTAMQKIDSYTPGATSIYYWLSRIAHNKAMDQHRRRASLSRRHEAMRAMVEPLMQPQAGPDALLELADDATALQARVGQTLETINPRYARALRLRFFEGRSRAEAADEMDVKQGTFDVLVHRALKAFRTVWEGS